VSAFGLSGIGVPAFVGGNEITGDSLVLISLAAASTKLRIVTACSSLKLRWPIRHGNARVLVRKERTMSLSGCADVGVESLWIRGRWCPVNQCDVRRAPQGRRSIPAICRARRCFPAVMTFVIEVESDTVFIRPFGIWGFNPDFKEPMKLTRSRLL
jgi:hypothetical protein